MRRRAQQGFTDVRARCEREPDLLREGSGFVLYALMDSVVDRYAPVIETLSAEIEELEDRIFEKHDLAGSRAIIEDLYSLKRRLVILAHHVTPLVDAVGKLVGGRIPQVCMGMQAYYRDVYDHLGRVSNMIDGRREMIVTAIQVNLGMISLAENEVTRRLGSFAALFAVPTMIAGIYGMNFEHIPELHLRFGYQICVAVMLLIDLFLFSCFAGSTGSKAGRASLLRVPRLALLRRRMPADVAIEVTKLTPQSACTENWPAENVCA